MKNTLMIRVCMLAMAWCCAAASVWACSSAVISGKVTPDGRPLLWKNRETGHLLNHMAYVKGEKYDFVANVNSDNFPAKKEAWIGSNTAGFALMNTQSYNLEKGDIADNDRGPKNGEVIYRALEVCATVADFCHFLDTITKPSGIEANFGVIDAQGGAAMFEVDGQSYQMFDANDPNVAPHGYVARTNFSNGGELNIGYGYVRFLEVDRVLSKACAMGGITPQLIFTDIARSFRNNILDIDLRSGDFNYPKTSGWFTDQDFIPRNNTTCSIVVQGVKKGENPELTALRTVLGYTPTSLVVPLWVKNNLPTMVSYDAELKASPLSAASMKMADEKVFHYKQGGGTSHYLHWENLYNLQGTGIMQRLMPIEEEIYRQTLPIQQKWYKQGKIDSKELDALYERIGEYLISEGVID
jgi:hypothetical protein